MSSPSDLSDNPADWSRTRQWQRQLAATATPKQRLEWLEAAMALAHASGALARLRQERTATLAASDVGLRRASPENG
ncbi:MAG: hypothetical protein H6714_06755 [Myxococcales bacterium]|nr:hypothetical protein [Myxococcales bacterium]